MKDMTPQEKLAARLELVAKRLDPDGPSVRDTPGLNSFAEITAEVRAIATALSEQGEVTTTTDASGRCVAVTRQDGEGRILSTIWEASEHGGGGEVGHAGYLVDGSYFYYADFPRSEWSKHNSVVPLYLHPPTPSAPGPHVPVLQEMLAQSLLSTEEEAAVRAAIAALSGVSAPVVDDALAERAECVRVDTLVKIASYGSAGVTERHNMAMRAALNFALSGVSAPVGVEAFVRDFLAEYNEHEESEWSPAWRELAERAHALTPPAAAPRVQHDWQAVSGSSAKKCARCGVLSDRLDGVFPKPCATPAASEDGLPSNFDDGGPYNGIDWQATCEALQAEVAELRRRLAASWQGVEWQPIESAPKDGRYVLLVHQSSGGRPYAGMWCHDDKQWADERGCIRVPTHWMPLPAAPTQEGK